MRELNVLLAGNLNPELGCFLLEADSKTKFIRKIEWACSPADVAKQVRRDRINTIILNPLTKDPFEPVDTGIVGLIHEVRSNFPETVVFLLYADRKRTEAALAQIPSIDLASFIYVDTARENDHAYFDDLLLALLKCKAYLSPGLQKATLRLRLALICLLACSYLVAMDFSRDWIWLQGHPNKLGLYLCASIIIISVGLALWRRQWQVGALTIGALGALLVIAQIIGR